MWHYRGTPFYLDRQGERLRLPRLLTHKARHNREIHEISTLLGQLCERWHRARKERDKPVFTPIELEYVQGTLRQCEAELDKLHALAGTAAAMCDEAWEAFGLAPPQRRFAVLCDFDPPGPAADSSRKGPRVENKKGS